MKRVGFLFAMALFVQGSIADAAGAQISNITTVIAETGASLSWAQDAAKLASVNEVDVLSKQAQISHNQISVNLEQRINSMFEKSLIQE